MTKEFGQHTWKEVSELLDEIPNVSTTFKLKEYVGAFMIKEYRQGQEFEEFESIEEQKQSDFEKLQQECIKVGLRPPKR